MENKDSGKFLKGLFCGVFLTLLCMALSLGFLRWKLAQDMRPEAQSEEAAGELNLNSVDLYRKIQEIEYFINAGFTGEIDTQKVEDSLYGGLMKGLDDPYSEYYSEDDMAMIGEVTSGIYSGIGATLMQDPVTKSISVVSCFANTPAAEAGILPGDVIVEFQGEEIGDMSLTQLVNTIKTGAAESFSFTLARGDERLEVTAVRREIKIPTVEYEMLEGNVGYLQILEFDQVTVSQFEEALEELQAQNMESLIIDVRDNPGGMLQAVCDILDLLLPEGLIVYTEDKYGERTEYVSDEEHKLELPLAVLINENSASASEIFAGAIKDYKLGTLVGKTTFGKGIVQRIYNLSDGSGIKLTTAKYYTPKGEDIHEKGIEPDVEVELDEELRSLLVIPKEKDNQLLRALEIVKNM